MPYPHAFTTTESLKRRIADIEERVVELEREREGLRREVERRLSLGCSVGVVDGRVTQEVEA